MSTRRWVVAALILLVGRVPCTSQECAREVARWGYGPARVVAVNGDSAVLTSGLVLMVADVSDPTDPVVLGQMDLDDGISDVALTESHAVAVNDHGGMLVVDLEEPSRPRPLGSLDATWVGEKVVLDGSHAWVAAGRRGLRVVDLVDPSRPVEVGALGALPYEREASDVALVGSIAFVAAGNLLVVDGSDPTAPILVGSHDLPGIVTGVAAVGDRVVVGSSWAAWGWSPATTTLTAMDATDPRNPAPVGALELDGWLSAMALSGDRVVFTKGPTAFSDRLWADVVDVSDPTAPALLTTARTSLTSNDVTFDADLVYAATELRGLRVLDLSVPGGEVIGGVDTPWATASVLPMSDGHVVTAEWGREPEGGGFYETVVRVLDLGTGEGVREVTTWTVPGWVRALSPLGEHAVLVLARGDTSQPDLLLAWGLSDPGAPQELARVELPHHLASDLATVGNHAYVVLRDRYRGGLRVFDFSQPAQPRDVAFLPLVSPFSIAVNERVAVLLAARSPERTELDVVDLSQPERPTVVGQAELPRLNGLEDIAITGDHVVVGGAGWAGRGVLHVVDATNPADPIHVLEYPLPLSVDRLVVAGRILFVKGARLDEGDIQVLDLSDPLRPLQVAVIPLAVASSAEMSTSTMATQGTRLFVAQWWAGLQVVDAGRCFGPYPRRVPRVFDR